MKEPYSDEHEHLSFPQAEQPSSNQDLLRLLRRRYQDEGCTISRKAADEIERLRAAHVESERQLLSWQERCAAAEAALADAQKWLTELGKRGADEPNATPGEHNRPAQGEVIPSDTLEMAQPDNLVPTTLGELVRAPPEVRQRILEKAAKKAFDAQDEVIAKARDASKTPAPPAIKHESWCATQMNECDCAAGAL
jgi:hypothetical protein